MNYNFSDLTRDAQREIFEQRFALDAAVELLAKTSNLDAGQIRKTLFDVAALQNSSRGMDEIAVYWEEVDSVGHRLIDMIP